MFRNIFQNCRSWIPKSSTVSYKKNKSNNLGAFFIAIYNTFSITVYTHATTFWTFIFVIMGSVSSMLLTNAGLLLIGPLGTNFSEIPIEILTFSFKKMRLKVSSAKRRPFCLGLNVLKACCLMGTMPLPGQIHTTCNKWFAISKLTHCGIVTPYGARDLGQH